MARIQRRLTVSEGSINHCTWQSHSSCKALKTDDAKKKFMALLKKYKDRYGIQILSYCLMDSHPHVVVLATKGQEAFSKFWKQVNWGIARWHNLQNTSSGQVVKDRMKSPAIQDGLYQLRVMRYGDNNPVRAKIAQSAGQWKWSSHNHYAYGDEDDLITDSPEYLALGSDPIHRRKAYLHLFAEKLAPKTDRPEDYVFVSFIGEKMWVDSMYKKARGLSPPEELCMAQ